MSGHSKWATTKHQKARADQKRAGAFTKVTKMIMVAAREGADPEMNFKLRLAIDKAKAVNMPKDNIERAIKKGAGLSEAEQYYSILYEAYAPGGVALVIEATTDNKNRTASNVRAILNKRGASLGNPNSVLYMFARKGVIIIRLNNDIDLDQFSLDLLENGADDIEKEDENFIVYTSLEKYLSMKKFLEDKNMEVLYSEIDYIPENTIEINDEESKKKILNIIEALESDDDVDKVYSNLKE